MLLYLIFIDDIVSFIIDINCRQFSFCVCVFVADVIESVTISELLNNECDKYCLDEIFAVACHLRGALNFSSTER